MNGMLKKYYYSELCEANAPAVYSDEANKAFYKQEKLYNELQKNLSKEDFLCLKNILKRTE